MNGVVLMPERVDIDGVISINSVRYPLKVGVPVRRFVASQPTARMTIGEASATTHQALSYVSWSDSRGGVGIERMDPATDIDRVWFSECTLRQKRHLTLPPLATQTAASGVTGSFTIGAIADHANVIYAAFGTAVRQYTPSTDSWGADVQTLGGGALDAISNFRLEGKVYTAFAYGSGYDYLTGSTWATSGKDADFLVYHDDRLWGIDTTGQLWWSSSLGTEQDDAQLPLVNAAITNLFVARSTENVETIYAATTNGVFKHDPDNNTFIPVEPKLPFHPDNGLGATAWRDASFVSAGLGVYKIVNGLGTAVVTLVGLDQDHGVPSDYRGRIRRLIPTLNGLVALLDATSNTAVGDTFQSQVITGSEVIAEDAGRSALTEWDDRGWQFLWTSDPNTLPVTVAIVSNAAGDYRLWWAQNQRIFHMTLPRDIVNPDQISDQNYESSATHELPWFDADETHLPMLVMVVSIHTLNATITETVAVRLRLNDDDTAANQTTLGTITTTGATDFVLPNSTTPTGTEARTFKIVLDLARGSTITNTPDVDRVEVYFHRADLLRWGISVTIKIPEEGFDLLSAEEMYANLLAPNGVVASRPVFEVTWRDRDTVGSNTNPYNYYMHVLQHTGMEATGNNFSGEHTLVMAQRTGS